MLRTLTLLALVAPLQPLCAEPRRPLVFARTEIGRSAPETPAFQRFLAAYRVEMEKFDEAGMEGWEFWLVLRAHPRRPGEKHVLVVGRRGRATVRVADVAVSNLEREGEPARVAECSLATVRTPLPRAALR